MNRILLLTQYYPPETGAPQNRLHSLAKFLLQKGFNVEVLTAMPNYPRNEIFESYRGKYSMKEKIDGVSVFRTWIFVSRSRSLPARLCNYFSFVMSSFFYLFFHKRMDVIICESPPLFLGFTAVLISKVKRAKLIFNVSDLWPESAEKLGIVTNRFFLGLASRLENWIYKNSDLISGQTQGIVENIQTRFKNKNIYWLPNGVDFDFFNTIKINENWRDELKVSDDDFVLCYAGILGHAQGLEVILFAADLLKHEKIKFLIVGDGPEKENLVSIATEKQLKNIYFVPNIEKTKIPALINACDAYIIPLKKLELFKGAIPSKIFEPMAMKKPVLLGVDGEARRLFIDEGNAGLYYEPEDFLDLSKKILLLKADPQLRLKLGLNGYNYGKSKFDREKIHTGFINELHRTVLNEHNERAAK